MEGDFRLCHHSALQHGVPVSQSGKIYCITMFIIPATHRRKKIPLNLKQMKLFFSILWCILTYNRIPLPGKNTQQNPLLTDFFVSRIELSSSLPPPSNTVVLKSVVHITGKYSINIFSPPLKPGSTKNSTSILKFKIKIIARARVRERTQAGGAGGKSKLECV